MDAIDMLTKDHNKVRGLFQKFNGGGGLTGMMRRMAGTVAPRERASALAAIFRELETHTRLEEQVFYPAVKALGDRDLNGMVQEALSEHGKVKDQMRALRARKAPPADGDGRVTELEQCVEHHASEEENEMFPRLEKLMPDAERADLARRMQALKKRASGSTRTSARASAGGRKRTAGRKAATGRKRTAGPKRAASRKRTRRTTTARKKPGTRVRKKTSARSRRR